MSFDANIQTMMREDITAAQGDQQSTVLWTNPSEVEESLNGTRGTIDDSDELDEGGNILAEHEGPLVIKLTEFADPAVLPAVSDIIKIDGTDYRIIDRDIDEFEVAISIRFGKLTD